MATPPSAATFLKALKAEGLTVVETDGWRTHNRNSKGAWGPVNGVMIHHTVTKGSANTVKICRTGYEGLPGPLCHGVITKDGRVHLVGYGRTNHAGSGDNDVLAAVVAERALPAPNETNTDGNARFYGFECENLGDGEDPWPDVQVEAMVRAAAALCRHHGWNERSVIGHKEWQLGKVDPRGVSTGGLRRRVAERLAHSAGWSRSSTTTYKVAKGDTLWSIAASKLGDGARWREIASLNGITDADAISVGQVLKLPKK
ncbi:N-acetylmuramoyl-L-alanine amidase [Streptomyces sp. CRN 30]|uniref:peptidoglycan recognition protein family protein n=1 Tax=Streptomyces sp. CRN 30 TaxID=3075613 RepID=UPI002A7F0575|nr:N-acetylmuramoyl-L-alanine amidase [Streptomyces sp. CRN 30]